MKKCLECNLVFDDNSEFCQNDGATLVNIKSGENQPYSNDTPTVFAPNFQTPVPGTKVVTGLNMKWVFPVIGTLLGVIVVLWFLAFSSQEKKESNQPTQQVEDKTEKKENSTLSKTDIDFSPTGNWTGGNPNNANYTAKAKLTEVNGEINGQIIWTLQNTKNRKKINKVGSSGVEFVKGNYNPQTLRIFLQGYGKNDPDGIITLNKYELYLSKDNQQISGKTIDGSLVLRR
jgi:rRNA maturation endonuclease Nob1